ncbi:serine/threonine-protein kinase [Streptomyces sp. NPDC002067]
MTDVHNGAHEDSEDHGNGGAGPDGGITPLTATDPARIGPYLLLGRLGAGGMGRVYLARSAAGRTVAVKVVHEEHVADPQFRARFRREINAARRVGARYTAPVLDAAPDAPQPWVATGYVPGLSLEQTVRGHGALPAASVLALAGGLLRALDDIHGAGIVHRDLKPSNVMLTADAPKVIDFGIARAVGTSVESLLTSTGMVIGSPGFMSPEQILGDGAGPASDVFTLGCVLTYAATGELPFGRGVSNQHAVMYHIVEKEPALDAVRDTGLRTLIGRCLTKDAAERPSVPELLAEYGDDPGTGAGTAWLPPEVLGRLARQSARLLDAEAAPVREAAPGGEVPDGEKPDGEASGGETSGGGASGGGAPDAAAPSAGAPDRKTVGLRPAAPAAPATVREPGQAPEGKPAGEPSGDAPEDATPVTRAGEGPGRKTGKKTGKKAGEETGKDSERRRRWRISVPVVLVLAVGGGTFAALAPYSRSVTQPPAAGAPHSTAPVTPAAPSGGTTASRPPKAKDGEDDGKADDPSKGADGKDGRDGHNGRDAEGGSNAPASGTATGGGSGSGGSSTSSGGGTSGGSGSSGGSGGGSTGGSGGSTAPASFAGNWTYGDTYNSGQPGTVRISRSGTVSYDNFPYNSCLYEGRVTSRTSSRINVSAAKRVGPNPGYCYDKLDPSYFTLNGTGLQHNVGAAHGSGYYYKRA